MGRVVKKTKKCADCAETLTLSRFSKNSAKKDGRQSECNLCRAIRKAESNPKQRIACGNGVKSCSKGCERHWNYAGLEYFIFDEVRYRKWLRARWFEGATVDRIDPTIGYVCRDGDVINDERFGNIRIVTWKVNFDNIRRAWKEADAA